MDARPPEMQQLERRQLRDVQAALLPRACPSCGHANVAAAFRPASGPIGGDFHEALPLGGKDGHVIGDVTGHGLGSSVVMGVLFGALRSGLRRGRQPAELLEDAHRLLSDLGQRSGGPRVWSATLFVSILHADGRLRAANAGHAPPLILRRGREPETLEATAPPAGLAAPESWEETEAFLEPGDRLLMYTDGLLQRGERHAELAERLARSGRAEPQAIVDALVDEGTDDDRTAVLVTYGGPSR